MKCRTSTNNSELIFANKIFFTFQPTDWTNLKRLMEIHLPIKNQFSTPNPFSTPGQTVGHEIYCTQAPSKYALARSCKKRSFFLATLQDLARSCRILRDLARFCRNLAAISCKIPAKSHKIPQDPAGSCKILQALAGVQEKRTLSCKILRERFYWEGLIITYRESIHKFTVYILLIL